MKNACFAVSLAAVVALSACDAPPPEEQLQEAAEDVRDARADRVEAAAAVDAAEARLDDEVSEVESAERTLQRARRRLRERQRVLSAERRDLDRVASDTAIFRLLQEQLLDDPQLSNLALVASVNAGRVTLSGDGATREQKEHAQALAVAVPGVEGVTNLIDVEDGTDE